MAEGKKLLKAAGVTFAVYFVIRYLLPYVIPFFIAYVLVHLLNPAVNAIRKKLPWKKEIIVSVLLILILTLFTYLFYLIYCQLMGQIRKIALNLDYYYDCFCGIVDRCCMLAEKSFGFQVDQIRDFVYSSLDHATEQIRVYIVPGVVNYSFRSLKILADAGLFLLMLFVSVILLMKDYDEMKEKLEQFSWYGHLHNVTQRMWKQGGMYMKAQMMIILVIIIICTVGLWALGNPYFLVLGIVVGIMDALPFIGTGTVLVPMAVFLLFRQNFRLAAGYIGLFLLTYVVRELLEPRLIGAKLGVYPFVMVVVVYAGLYLFGPAGVLLGPVMLLTVLEILREFQ
ncbi:MAG TPA: AI-2E family transporter [Candidatus Choladousia intestinipullorum]|nr:AI-2E family transporter [Candidatus Choladousia intestinipullorum]